MVANESELPYFIRVCLLFSFDQSNPKSWDYFDWPFMLIYKQGPFLFWKKFQEVTEININVLHTEMEGYYYYSKFKYWNQKKKKLENRSK